MIIVFNAIFLGVKYISSTLLHPLGLVEYITDICHAYVYYYDAIGMTSSLESRG